MATGCGVGEAQQSSPSPDSSANGEDSVITVFAAASLTEAFNAIAREYQSLHPDSEVVLNFDGSQRLRTQLEHGARADVFASADWDQMEAVVDLGLTSSPAVNFASNRLAILAFAGSAGNLDIATLDTNTMQQPAFRIQLEALARPETKIVLGQGEVPIGRYTEKLLENIEAAPHLGQQMAKGLRANVVSREANVRAIVQKVNLGEADAGVVYSSNAFSDRRRSEHTRVARTHKRDCSLSNCGADSEVGKRGVSWISSCPSRARKFYAVTALGRHWRLEGTRRERTARARRNKLHRSNRPSIMASSLKRLFTGTDPMGSSTRIPVGSIATALYVAFICLPILALLFRALSQEVALASLFNDNVLQALWLSLFTSTISMVVVVVVGTPFALSLARSRSAAMRVVDQIVELPIILPPVVAGVAMLLAFGSARDTGTAPGPTGNFPTFHYDGCDIRPRFSWPLPSMSGRRNWDLWQCPGNMRPSPRPWACLPGELF